MAIVFHTLETTQQANGTTHNIVRMFDQDGGEHMASFYAAQGIDPATLVGAHITLMDAHMAEQEFGNIVGTD